MSQHIAQWGNSLAIRLPLQLAHQMGLQVGQPIDLQLTAQGGLLLQPLEKSATHPRQAKGMLANRPRQVSHDTDEADFLAAIGSDDATTHP